VSSSMQVEEEARSKDPETDDIRRSQKTTLSD
jgi:hypothetical protein